MGLKYAQRMRNAQHTAIKLRVLKANLAKGGKIRKKPTTHTVRRSNSDGTSKNIGMKRSV